MCQVSYLQGLHQLYLLVYLNTMEIPCLNNRVSGNFPRGKGGLCVGLTTLPPSCARFLELQEPETAGTLRFSPEFYRDCLTLPFTMSNKDTISKAKI